MRLSAQTETEQQRCYTTFNSIGSYLFRTDGPDIVTVTSFLYRALERRTDRQREREREREKEKERERERDRV